tara:strand:- start:2011 stop:2112 length:102 start_codon:yes stop_codon:yes gene_type:complete
MQKFLKKIGTPKAASGPPGRSITGLTGDAFFIG